MPKVTFLSGDGVGHTIDADTGTSLMQTALANNVDGIIGECGGQAMCATCHVYVDDEYAGLLAPRSEDEDEMLELTACPRGENSRLSCQIPVTDDVDGIVVRLPENQL